MNAPAPRFLDSLRLLASEWLGGLPGDKLSRSTHLFTPMQPAELLAAFRGNWIARKCVTIPAYDSVRAWRDWQAEKDQITALEEAERRHNLRTKLLRGQISARLYGGSIVYMGIKGQNPQQELVPETVNKDGIEFLHVLSRLQVTIPSVNRDVRSSYYGEPEFYEVREQGNNANVTRIHPSRVVRLTGAKVPDLGGASTIDECVWGDSVLDAIDEAVKHASGMSQSLANIVNDLHLDVIKMPNLSDALSTAESRTKVANRFHAANTIQSTAAKIILDSAEEWQRVTANLAGAPDLLLALLLVAGGACDIPATRFLGQSPQGLNATGEHDLRNYYDHVNADQELELRPALSKMDEVLIRDALGARPDEVHYRWTSLWQDPPATKASTYLAKAQAFKLHADSGLIPDSALAEGLVNQLVEDGTYPGLEEAVAAAEAEGDVLGVSHTPVQTLDPETGKPIPHPGSPAQVENQVRLSAANNNLPSAAKKAKADNMRLRAKLLADMADELDGGGADGGVRDPGLGTPPDPPPPSPPTVTEIVDAMRAMVQDEVRAALQASRPPPQPGPRLRMVRTAELPDGRRIRITEEPEG